MKWLYAPRPIDYAMRATRTEHLAANAKAYVAYDKLERHYWHCGSLYREDRELAAASGLSVTSFRLVKALLIRLFDVDETGLWRDYDLEQDREATIVALGLGDPADYRARPDSAVTTAAPAAPGTPGQRLNRSTINSRNAHSGWEKRRGLREAQGGPKAAATDADQMQNGMQVASGFASVSMQNGMQNGDANDPKSGAVLHAFATSHAASSLDDEDDDSIKSSSSSSNPDVPARDANAKSDANSHRGASPGLGERSAPIVKDSELLDVFLVETGGNIEPRLRNITSVKPYRDLMREGCDLELHIVPELQAVRTLHTPLKQPCPDWMRGQIRSRRDAVVQPPRVAGRGDPAHQYFAVKGSPQDIAWREYKKKVTGRDFTLVTKAGDREGWGFAAEWPPEWPPEVPAAMAAAR